MPAVQSPAPDDAPRAVARSRRRGVLLALGLLLALGGLLEIALRVALHVPAAQSWPVLGALGEPGNFGAHDGDEAYWEARAWRGPAWGLRGHGEHDARLGWRSRRFAAGDLAHVLEPELAGRTPVLLFGDSYAEGMAPDTADDFPRLFARTELADRYAMLNYGAGGYGLDQIVLLLEGALARHAERRPLVLLSLLVDDDLDRCVLAFRVWPKPRLRLEDGRLVGEDEPVPSMPEYLERESAFAPLHLTPFLGALWARVDGARAGRREAEKQALARALLERAVAALRAADAHFLVVLFRHGESLEDARASGWRAALVGEVLDGLGAPWVDVGPAFAAHRALSGRTTWEYFLPPEHPGAGHYNALGDALAFEVVREGLREHLGLGRGGELRVAQDVRPLAGEAPIARWRESDRELEQLGLRPPFLEVGAGLVWELREARELRVRVQVLGADVARVAVLHDGEAGEALECLGGEAREVVLDLRGTRRLEWVPSAREGSAAPRVVLSELEIENLGRFAPPLR